MRRIQLVTQHLLLSSLFLLASCATVPDNNDTLPVAIDTSQENVSTDLTIVMPDSSCSYFYLLLGIHAENNQRFQEAEEAYEKALICDSDSKYILRKLPFLFIRMKEPEKAAQWLRKAIEKFPGETADRLFLARLAIQKKDIEEAIQLYKEVLALTPEDDTLLLRIGFLQSQQNNYSDAEKTLKKSLELNPNSLFAYLYLARLAKQTKKYKKAEEYYLKALHINWSVELALELADYYALLHKNKKVEEQYRTIYKNEPNDLRGGLGLVHILLLQKKQKQAFTILEELRTASNAPDTIDLVTARLYLSTKELKKAATVLKPLALKKKNEEALYMLSVIRYQQDDIDRAVTLLKMIKADSNFHEDALSLQVRIFMDKKQYKTATALLQEAIKNNKNSSPELYTLLASLYMEQGLFQDGYRTLDAALTAYPNNTKIYFEYGLLLEKENKRELALQRMSSLLKIDPNYAEALNYIGYTWADMGINLEQALAYIQKAIELKPENGYIRDSLGWVYFRMGKLNLATREIQKALQLEPNDPYIHEHLGDIYLQLGKLQKALKSYKEAQKLFKNFEKQKQMQDRIDAL